MLLNDTGYPKDWPVVHLDRITKRGSGHTPSKSHPEYWNGNIKWVSLADSYRLDAGYISDTDKKISPKGIKNSSAALHPPETVILSRDAGVGKSAVIKEAMAVSQHFIAWDCSQVGKVAPWFLYYTLQFHQRELERQAVGSTIKTIGLPFFKNLEIALPPLSEQKKIAAILSTWDRAIEGTEKLLANSQQQKKALMQQLLTGKKRLPGFSGEWNIRKFQDLFHERTETEREDMPLLSVTANDGVIFQEDSGRKDISKEDKSKYKRICVGDIGYNTMRMWQGRSCLSDKEGIVSPAYTIVFAKKDICTRFASYLFKFSPVIHVFYRHSQGLVSDTWNLKFKHFKEISWKIPPLPEQKAIAVVLSTADEEITAIESDLSRLRQEKKALMQQLLTGKHRVKVD